MCFRKSKFLNYSANHAINELVSRVTDVLRTLYPFLYSLPQKWAIYYCYLIYITCHSFLYEDGTFLSTVVYLSLLSLANRVWWHQCCSWCFHISAQTSSWCVQAKGKLQEQVASHKMFWGAALISWLMFSPSSFLSSLAQSVVPTCFKNPITVHIPVLFCQGFEVEAGCKCRWVFLFTVHKQNSIAEDA